MQNTVLMKYECHSLVLKSLIHIGYVWGASIQTPDTKNSTFEVPRKTYMPQKHMIERYTEVWFPEQQAGSSSTFDHDETLKTNNLHSTPLKHVQEL